MSHNWGVSVPADMPTEKVIEIRDKLRAGQIEVEFPDSVRCHAKEAQWREEIEAQMLAAYEKEAARRVS